MASILRHDAPPAPEATASVRPATFTLANMANQGDRYIDTVRAEAAKIVAEARAEADEIRSNAEAEGRAAAHREIQTLLDKQVGGEMQTLRPALISAIGRLQAGRGEWLEKWRRDAVGLAVAIAERIVRRELRDDPTISEAWLSEALNFAAGASEVTVRLSEQDHERLRGHGEFLAESISGLGQMHFIADASVTPGGCRVETRHGSIDLQLETQLDRLAEELAAG